MVLWKFGVAAVFWGSDKKYEEQMVNGNDCSESKVGH